MRSLNDAHQRYSHSDIAKNHPVPQAHPQKFGRAFSKCKSCNGNTGDEEQKMFTSQKYSMLAEQSLAPVAAVFLKTSSIIANGSLMRGIAYAAAISAMVGAAP